MMRVVLGRLRVVALAWGLLAIAASGCSALTESPTAEPPPKATVGEVPSPTVAVITPEPTATEPPTATPRPRPARVLVISLDGLRPDALSAGRTPVMWALAEAGASTFRAQTILPSATLMAHASMLSGYDVERHGVTWNDYVPSLGFIQSPTLFSIAHDAGLETEMVVGKEKLVHIAAPGTVDSFTYVPKGDFGLAEEAAKAIADGFDVLFVHFPGPDAAGHNYGWMSDTYLGTVANSDEAVGRVLEALDSAGFRESTLILVTADHGGHGTLHGSSLPEDTTIPWIVAGPGVVAGTSLSTEVMVYDTAATALWALGLPLPEDLDGTPVLEAFGETAFAPWVEPAWKAPPPKVIFLWLRPAWYVGSTSIWRDRASGLPIAA